MTVRPPNIVLILADNLGWGELGCYGGGVLRGAPTPRIDALAAEGLTCLNFNVESDCVPTRSALMTGRHPIRTGAMQSVPAGLPQGLIPWEITLGELLQEAGYATACFGKWHLGDKEEFWPLAQGFDINIGGCGLGGPPTYWDPYRIPTIEPRKTGEYLTDRLADETIHFMRDHKDKPMFICLWTYNPHFPFEAPADLTDYYKGKEGPGLKNPIFGGQVEATDRAVGKVIDELDRLKIAENTLVIFTSDNGGWTGASDNRPLRAGKGHLYEGGLRVPLIIRWPGVTKSDTTNNTPVISMDLTATILDAAGISLAKEETLDGQSIKQLLTGEPFHRDALYFHYPHFAFHIDNRPGSAMRSGQYKLILNFDDGSLELYDLEKDLGEMKNLAAEQPDIASAMHAKLKAWLTATKAGIPQPR